MKPSVSCRSAAANIGAACPTKPTPQFVLRTTQVNPSGFSVPAMCPGSLGFSLLFSLIMAPVGGSGVCTTSTCADGVSISLIDASQAASATQNSVCCYGNLPFGGTPDGVSLVIGTTFNEGQASGVCDELALATLALTPR